MGASPSEGARIVRASAENEGGEVRPNRLAVLQPLTVSPVFRRYFFGISISQIGTWMQRVCQEWLVLEISGSGVWLGLIVAFQFVPMLILSPWGGVVADRYDRRKVILATQLLSAAIALTLAIVTLTGTVSLLNVSVLALLLGLVTVIDNPARRSFVSDLVPPEEVKGAVALSNMMSNLARAIGPVLGGVFIATLGMGWAFLANAGTYVVVVGCLLALDVSAMIAQQRVPREAGQIRSGLRYVWVNPDLRRVIVMMSVAGVGAYSYSVTLPLLVSREFGLGAGALGILNAALGLGALAGGLAMKSGGRPGGDDHLRVGGWFGASVILLSLAPNMYVASVILGISGALSIQFVASSSAYSQVTTRAEFRGRVMALWGMAFIGTRPIGATLIGWLSEWQSVRLGLVVGGAMTLLTALALLAPRSGRLSLVRPRSS